MWVMVKLCQTIYFTKDCNLKIVDLSVTRTYSCTVSNCNITNKSIAEILYIY